MDNPNSSPVLTLSVSLQEINCILGALSELPAKISMELITKLKHQAVSQLQAPDSANRPEQEP